MTCASIPAKQEQHHHNQPISKPQSPRLKKRLPPLQMPPISQSHPYRLLFRPKKNSTNPNRQTRTGFRVSKGGNSGETTQQQSKLMEPQPTHELRFKDCKVDSFARQCTASLPLF